MQKSNSSALYTLISVFFFWGFVAASNGIFIPFCKTHFSLTQFESQLIDFTFYGGYFIGSIILYAFSQMSKVDILNKIGYKKGIISGLILSAAGALMMIPAVNAGSFAFILTALFVVALGFSLQQTSAQPFVVALGPAETGAHRLNLAGGVNNFGSLLGPIIVSLLLFGTAAGAEAAEVSIGSINNLYLILAGLFLAVAGFYAWSKLPNVNTTEDFEGSSKPNFPLFVLTLAFLLILAADPIASFSGIPHSYLIYASLLIIVLTVVYVLSASSKNPNGWGAMQYPQLVLGMLAIFIYVGVEVSIQSNLGALLALPDFGGYEESAINPFICLYWGSMMVGRWTGAVSVFNVSKQVKLILTIVVPFIAFGIILLANHVTGTDVSELYVYGICIAILVIGFIISQEKPARMLAIFAVLGIVAMSIGLISTGNLALYAFITGGLICSIMWPCIFSLSVTGLGKYTSQGSSFLIMMILGGAIIPPVQGIFADNNGIHFSYIIPVFCFAYLLYFAWKVSSVLKKQGFDVNAIEAEGGH